MTSNTLCEFLMTHPDVSVTFKWMKNDVLTIFMKKDLRGICRGITEEDWSTRLYTSYEKDRIILLKLELMYEELIGLWETVN